jgi:hypothetical protein
LNCLHRLICNHKTYQNAFQVKPFLSHKITPPESKVQTSTKELLDMFTLM